MADDARAFRILFVINSLEGGGAERVMCMVAAAVAGADKHWKVTLATLDQARDSYALSESVTRIRLNAGGSLLWGMIALRGLVRRERPDVIVSFLTRSNCAAIACSQLAGIPCVISERVHTTSHLSSGRGRRLKKALIRCLYPYADRIVTVSQGIRDDLVEHYGVAATQVVTIHNPVDAELIRRAAQAPPSIDLPHDFIVAIGRLVANKNFSMLLRSYAAANIGSSLVILGEGAERSRLETLASELGVSDKVHLPGFVANPHAVLERAQFYVSPSNAEGFPNAMIEAMCIGLPVVSTDCDSGPSEILRGEAGAPKVAEMTKAKFGILVPPDDEHAMSAALQAMSEAHNHRYFAAAARRRAHDFSLDNSLTEYRSVISSSLSAPTPSRQPVGAF
ncbi:glycosyltransferase [Microvirga makkahensis]|uniref:Glycosyltransferase n=1 Tax=Microvirga makkahensis TaxID=1128670 RepID=A0A7X3MUS3_9HYPH|nr:glycosyltransferase [Microvirga makkahensis]MXQ13582.1 glycosyltransferase [Microvirga makkahensis]